MKKIAYLDGLRGTAAIMVYLHHFAYAFYPAMIFGLSNLAHGSLEQFVYGTPFGLLSNGRLAVNIFLVLAGFFVTYHISPVRQKPVTLRQFVVSRWVRIAGPGIVSVVLGYLLVKSGFMLQLMASRVSFSPWLATSLPPHANFFQAIKESMLATIQKTTTQFNNNLWPLYLFFLGSLIIFVFVRYVKKRTSRIIISVLAVLLLYGQTYLASLFLGSLLADLFPWLSGQRGQIKNPTRLGWLFIIIGLGLGTMPLIPGDMNTAYRYWALPGIRWWSMTLSYYTVSAGLLVTGIFLLPVLQSFFSLPRLQKIGTYSYSIFILHHLVLVSIGSLTLLVTHAWLPYDLAVLVTFVVTSTAVFLLSKLFYQWVEKPFHKLSVLIKTESGE